MIGVESGLGTFLDLQVSLAVEDQILSTVPMWQPFSSPTFFFFLMELLGVLLCRFAANLESLLVVCANV